MLFKRSSYNRHESIRHRNTKKKSQTFDAPAYQRSEKNSERQKDNLYNGRDIISDRCNVPEGGDVDCETKTSVSRISLSSRYLSI